MAVGAVRPIASRANKKAKLRSLSEVVRDGLAKITELERAGCPSVDEPASLFGELLGEIFAFGLPESERLVPYQCGYHLGKGYEFRCADLYGRVYLLRQQGAVGIHSQLFQRARYPLVQLDLQAS